jgi:ubiquinone/menaquinone biosynthesis C-methylase UbiE
VDEFQFDRFADEYRALQAASVRISGEGPEYFWRYKVVDLALLCAATGLQPRSVLDFGAGVGNSVPYLREAFPGAGITCLDVSRKSLAVGEQRFLDAAKFIWFDGGRIPIEDATYDVALVACVLHHIEASEHERLLGELHRVVRPGGLVMVYEHNPYNPLTRKVVRECAYDEGVTLIAPRVLARRFRAAGLLHPVMRYRVFFPRALASLRPLESALGWLPLGAQYYVYARA